MPLSEKKKVATLKYLRRWFNHVDAFREEKGRSLEFSEQVKADVEEIVKAGLLEDIEDWGEKCSHARNKNNYTYQEVARLLRVHPRAIQKQEEKTGVTKVDAFYLEAFSLIYHQNPYILLWEKEQTDEQTGKRKKRKENPDNIADQKIAHLSCPFSSCDDQNVKYRNVIFNSLFDENDLQKLEHLETLTRIGKVRAPTCDDFLDLFSFLKKTIAFCNVFTRDPLEDASAENSTWELFAQAKPLDPDQRGSDEYHKREIFWDAYHVVLDLGWHDPERLKVLAQLALCDEVGAKILRSIVFDAGYPIDSKSLQSYGGGEIVPEFKHYQKGESKDPTKKRIHSVDNLC